MRKLFYKNFLILYRSQIAFSRTKNTTFIPFFLDLARNQRFALPNPRGDNVPLKEIDVPNAFLVLALLLFTPHVVFAAPPDTLREDWENHFSQQQAKGTLVVHDLRQPEAPRLVFNPPRARERFSPASTFKIPHTLIALAHEAIKDEFTQLRWDGINRGSAPWNRDQDLRSAMRHSVVWSYQLLARRIGETAERAEIVRLDYGNRTVGPKVDDFWLDGSLRISAHEQIDFLSRLYRNQLPYTLGRPASRQGSDDRGSRPRLHREGQNWLVQPPRGIDRLVGRLGRVA